MMQEDNPDFLKHFLNKNGRGQLTGREYQKK